MLLTAALGNTVLNILFYYIATTFTGTSKCGRNVIKECALDVGRILVFRADSICNNPIPEWQSRIGMRGSFYERSDAVCTTVFGIDVFARIFGPTRA